MTADFASRVVLHILPGLFRETPLFGGIEVPCPHHGTAASPGSGACGPPLRTPGKRRGDLPPGQRPSAAGADTSPAPGSSACSRPAPAEGHRPPRPPRPPRGSSRSRMGFAHRPGTEVEPTCSTAASSRPRAAPDPAALPLKERGPFRAVLLQEDLPVQGFRRPDRHLFQIFVRRHGTSSFSPFPKGQTLRRPFGGRGRVKPYIADTRGGTAPTAFWRSAPLRRTRVLPQAEQGELPRSGRRGAAWAIHFPRAFQFPAVFKIKGMTSGHAFYFGARGGT